jgi:hypothetical protein
LEFRPYVGVKSAVTSEWPYLNLVLSNSGKTPAYFVQVSVGAFVDKDGAIKSFRDLPASQPFHFQRASFLPNAEYRLRIPEGILHAISMSFSPEQITETPRPVFYYGHITYRGIENQNTVFKTGFCYSILAAKGHPPDHFRLNLFGEEQGNYAG